MLVRGDLKSEYGVPWEQIDWHVQNDELVPWRVNNVSIRQIPAGKDAEQMLVESGLDAMVHPLPPAAALTRPDRVRRLFAPILGTKPRDTSRSTAIVR